MRLAKTALIALSTLAAGVGCSQGDAGQGSTASGGSSGSGTGGAGQTGGTGGGTGGSGGNAGAVTTGGTAGTTSTGGMGGGTPAGGSAGTGGAGAGGTGGMAGTGGTAGTGGIDPETILPRLDGLFWGFRTTNEADPGSFKYWLTDSGEQCPEGDTWATAGITRSQTFEATGVADQQYTINFELRGALALRCYTGGTPSEMLPDATGVNNAFYVGGQQFDDSVLNTLELAVTPAVTGQTASTYFLNGIPSTSDMCDQQITYEVAYKNQFVIMGDSTVTLSTHASDCQALQNCGSDPAGAGCVPRIVNVDGVEVHASPYQPIADVVGGNTFYPQWLVFDIQSITSP